MKQIFALIGFILFSASVCCAQFSDNFSDGDFTFNPTWIPDVATNWIVKNNQLQSNSTLLNSSFFISTPSATALNAQWEFYVNLPFNTSGANYVDIHLTSSSSNLLTSNGYFVRIGGTPDEISLYKNTAGVSSLLINGADGITNVSDNILKIKVTRNEVNLWTLQRDLSGIGNNYVSEGSVTDLSFATSSFFGIRIVQSTASFFGKHTFDDFYVGPIIQDTAPPVLSSIDVISSTEINLLFNEELDPASAQTNSHYGVANGIGNPSSAVLQADQKTVTLIFNLPFANGVQQQLSLSDVKDLLGNSMPGTNRLFLFFQAFSINSKDIIVTEVFADPSPQIGLPDTEFIEIYNRSGNPIDIDGWKLSDGSSTAIFPSQIILPKEYWIITSSPGVTKFRPFGKTIGLANFPTLNNDSDVITLRTTTNTIDSINYNLTWYRDEDKQNGGWSLELIDPQNACGEANNWASSIDPKGGTPAKQNSVFANKPDLTGPRLLSIAALQVDQLVLSFDEKLEKPLGKVAFNITPSISISSYFFSNPSLTEIKIILSQSLAPRQLYQLQVSNLRDCAKNFIQPDFSRLDFALPELADSLDIVVNEILFNPRPGGVDFLEVYNRSPKYINLNDFKIANFENGVVKNAKPISSTIILAPSSFLAFTPKALTLKTQYLIGQEKNFFELELPGFNDDAGSVALINGKGKVLDYFMYSDQYHSRLLKDKEGVSLERISVIQHTNDPANWKSSNSTDGFATPGYLNSNSRPESSLNENSVRVDPEVFSPLQPGQEFSKINYHFDQSGLVTNVKIIDQEGRLIKTLANNATIGLEGFFRWDGDRDDGSLARLGYYVVWFEVFDLTGYVSTIRKRVVIAARD
jgi:hypothetical protein